MSYIENDAKRKRHRDIFVLCKDGSPVSGYAKRVYYSEKHAVAALKYIVFDKDKYSIIRYVPAR